MADDIQQIFQRRLRQARIMAKLSLRGLSAAMGDIVSYVALSKYEKGAAMPNSEVLSALCRTLRQPADFFFRPFRVEIKNIEFRKHAELSKSEERSVIENAKDFFERYNAIEELLGCAVPYKPLFAPGEVIKNEEEAEKAAEKLRSAKGWNLGSDPLPNVHELLELHGIKVYEAQTEDQRFDGFSGTTDNTPVVVIASWLNKNLPRKRWTEVHELAHIILPVSRSFPKPDREWLANRFTGAFLLPRETFITQFGGNRHTISQGELLELKAFFGVSMMAIMMRAKHLHLLPQAVCDRFFAIARQHGWCKNGEPENDRYQGNENYNRFRRLVFHAVAEEVISSSLGASFLKIGLDEFRGEFQQLFA